MLNGVGKIFVTYGNGIINQIAKDGIDSDIEDSIISFRQRVNEINKVNDELVDCLREKYGDKYTREIKTLNANSAILEQALDTYINNEHIRTIITTKDNYMIFDFVFHTISNDVRDRQVEYIDAKNYLTLFNLEVLTMGKFKWYHADGVFDNNSMLCRVKIDKRNEYLSKWLKNKIIASCTDYLFNQIELILP